MITNRLRIIVRLLALPCALAACATTPPSDPFDNEGAIWPAPPETGRIAFVTEFSGSSDLGIRKSVWARLIGLAAGNSEDRMLRPMAIAATADGSVVFVADPDARCVHRYDIGRGRYDCMVPDDQSGITPIGLAITSEGQLFVSDSQNGRLLRASPGDDELSPFAADVRFERPTGMYWDSNSEQLFVTDTLGQVVVVVDTTGQLLMTLGERGSQAGQFNFPTYLCVDGDGELLVTDSLNFRIQRFDEQRNFVQMFGENGDQQGSFARPKGVAVDTSGHVYVVDSLLHTMQVFDRDGQLLLSVGVQGQAPGEFWLPNGIFVTDDDTIFVADSYNKRVQVFRYVGPRS